MNYITPKEASEKWNISTRRINTLCIEGRIPGAQKHKRYWMIPESAEKPTDARERTKPLKEPGILLFNSSYAEYHSPKEMHKYDRILSECQMLFLMGKFQESIILMKEFLKNCDNKQYLLIANFIYERFSIILGNEYDKKSASKQISDLLSDPEIDDLTKALILIKDSPDRQLYPVFFEAGSNVMKKITPYISLITLKKFIVNALKNGNSSGIINSEIVCHALPDYECPEIYVYYHIVLAFFYTMTGADCYANAHLSEALRVALPRKWYTPFSVYWFIFDYNFIKAVDIDFYTQVTKLAGDITTNQKNFNLFPREISHFRQNRTRNIQVAYQIACGKSNSEISQLLGLSTYKVKKCISEIYENGGFNSRSEIKDYILSHFKI